MNAHTRMSGKGQIVVPRDTRDRLGWEPGLDLEVIEHEDSVTLRRRRPAKTLSPEQAVSEFRRLYRHDGPPVSLAQMEESAKRMASGEDRILE